MNQASRLLAGILALLTLGGCFGRNGSKPRPLPPCFRATASDLIAVPGAAPAGGVPRSVQLQSNPRSSRGPAGEINFGSGPCVG